MKRVVADSSFYICFLDDINQPKYLERFFQTFIFVIGKILKKEISRSTNFRKISAILEEKCIVFEYENFGELLRPIFAEKEIKKGEHEVVAISIVLHFLGYKLIIILDEESGRKFLLKNFPEMEKYLTGTVGFLKDCTCKYRILLKEETLEILHKIMNSKFRIKKRLIEKIIIEVEKC